jgi:hypothetical protein
MGGKRGPSASLLGPIRGFIEVYSLVNFDVQWKGHRTHETAERDVVLENDDLPCFSSGIETSCRVRDDGDFDSE